uniref:SAP domain-containing protein n=1 Tax=Loa loa TaxID=7209 RepID=A0A1I7VZW6_LOALO
MCDESEPSIGGRPISEMKVVELKEELGKRGLSKIGNKNALHERLKEYLLTEVNAKYENEVQSTAVESPQRDLTSPPNPLVAEYLAKQQTALREARKDAEAVRRASSGDDASPIREKSVSGMRRSRRGRSSATVEKPAEFVVTSETEQDPMEADSFQESVEAQLKSHNNVEETENDSSAPLEVLKKETDDGVDSVSTAVKVKTSEEIKRTKTEHDERRLASGQQSVDPGERWPASTKNVSEEHELQKKHEDNDEEEDAVSDVASSDMGTSSQSRSEAADESNASWEQMPVDLEELSNQEVMQSVDDTSVKKTVEGTKETTAMQIKTKVAFTQEKKRRWKPSETTQSTNSVVKISVVKHKEEEIEIDEQEDTADPHASAVSDFKEELSETKDRMEELDYEEPVQSSIAEVAEEVKAAEEISKRCKERIFERVERHAKRSGTSCVSKRSPTPDKQLDSHTTVDGFVRERRVSPARYPVNQVIMIRQLTRPYTVKQLQQLLSTFGTIVEGGFWIDNIKSTCIAKYSTVEEAVVARGRLHNVVWPPSSPKTLKIDYSDDANLTKHLIADQSQNEEITKGNVETAKSGNSAPTLRVSLSVDEKRRHVLPTTQDESAKDFDKRERDGRGHERRGRKRSASPVGHSETKRARERRSPWRDERHHTASPEFKPNEPEKRVKTADELFLKTKTQPAVYYLPLTEEQIIERTKRKAVEAELVKKVAQNGTTKRKEKNEPAKEKTSTSKRIPITAPPSLGRRARKNTLQLMFAEQAQD